MCWGCEHQNLAARLFTSILQMILMINSFVRCHKNWHVWVGEWVGEWVWGGVNLYQNKHAVK